MRFVLAKGSKFATVKVQTDNMEVSWTCCRTLDSTCVQLDYILQTFAYRLLKCGMILPFPLVWIIAVPIASYVFNGAVDRACDQQRGLKWWQPTLDSNGLPAKFHNILRMNKVRGLHNSLEGLERSLRDAGQQGGNRENTYLRFQPSGSLKRLRAERRATRDTQLRKIIDFLHTEKP